MIVYALAWLYRYPVSGYILVFMALVIPDRTLCCQYTQLITDPFHLRHAQ
jgi:hypothetical protein